MSGCTVQVDNRSAWPELEGDTLPGESTHAPSAEAVTHIARAALDALGVSAGELSVSLVSDEEIAALNGRWRGKPMPTNVLSFPMDDPALLGDVVVSLETVARQGAETGAGYAYTFAFYLVHGILHLHGWDHHTDAEEAAMRVKTEAILESAGLS